ncbi:LysR family transcriptional regulator [Alcaligenaceae bacterium CGII-47]|nr:LysR family transcriptional regulator [Alcaligenaceae bacterium CGII-47]
MEIRHLRCFLALVEEQHFTRAAERMFIEQSPFSRNIKELEERLNSQLFERDRRKIRLTQAGEALVPYAKYLFTMLEHATVNVQAISSGHHQILRIGVSEGALQPRLASLLSELKAEQGGYSIRLFDITLSEQIHGLRHGLLELGLARSNVPRREIITTPLWQDTLVAVVPKNHPILRHQRIPLDELLKYPMIGSDPDAYGGYHHQIDRVLRTGNIPPRINEWAKSIDMLITLISAGHGVAIASASRLAACNHDEIVVRPLDAKRPLLMTYLLQHESLNSAAATDFIERMRDQQGYEYDEGDGCGDDEMECPQNIADIPLTQPSYGMEPERLRV